MNRFAGSCSNISSGGWFLFGETGHAALLSVCCLSVFWPQSFSAHGREEERNSSDHHLTWKVDLFSDSPPPPWPISPLLSFTNTHDMCTTAKCHLRVPFRISDNSNCHHPIRKSGVPIKLRCRYMRRFGLCSLLFIYSITHSSNELAMFHSISPAIPPHTPAFVLRLAGGGVCWSTLIKIAQFAFFPLFIAMLHHTSSRRDRARKSTQVNLRFTYIYTHMEKSCERRDQITTPKLWSRSRRTDRKRMKSKTWPNFHTFIYWVTCSSSAFWYAFCTIHFQKCVMSIYTNNNNHVDFDNPGTERFKDEVFFLSCH